MVYKTAFLIFGVGLLLIYSATVQALECYKCRDVSGTCKPDEPGELVNCSMDYEICAKMHGKNSWGKESIARLCLPRQDFKEKDCTEFIKGVEHCIYKCNTDGCNSAPASLTPRNQWIALTGSLFVLMFIITLSSLF